jgi:hypothetical protein
MFVEWAVHPFPKTTYTMYLLWVIVLCQTHML